MLTTGHSKVSINGAANIAMPGNCPPDSRRNSNSMAWEAANSGNTCSAGASSAASAASQAWLLGNWGATTYDQVPVGRASFGLYSNSTDIIYQREQY